MKIQFFAKKAAIAISVILLGAASFSINTQAAALEIQDVFETVDKGSEEHVRMKYDVQGITKCSEATRQMFGKKLENKISDDMARSALETEVVKREALMQAKEAREELERKQRAIVRYSERDLEVLQRIVQAEAGGQDAEGKMLVANVILNRVRSKSFPNNITDVVYEPKQFTPVMTGVINTVSVSDETRRCVERALEGEDYSDGATYFMNRRTAASHNSSWFDRHLTYVRTHGGHEFFK